MKTKRFILRSLPLKTLNQMTNTVIGSAMIGVPGWEIIRARRYELTIALREFEAPSFVDFDGSTISTHQIYSNAPPLTRLKMAWWSVVTFYLRYLDKR